MYCESVFIFDALKGRLPVYCLFLRERRSPARRVRREGDTCLSPGATKGRGSGWFPPSNLTIMKKLR